MDKKIYPLYFDHNKQYIDSFHEVNIRFYLPSFECVLVGCRTHAYGYYRPNSP